MKPATKRKIRHMLATNPQKLRPYQIVEAMPEIKTREMGWYRQKGKPGFMREAEEGRGKIFVYPSPPRENEHAFAHTHPFYALRWAISTPSLGDLNYFLTKHVFGYGLKVWHIKTVDRHGKVTGYFSMRATKKLVNSPEEIGRVGLFIEEVWEKYSDSTPKVTSKIAEIIRRMLKENGFLVEHAIPRKGYVFRINPKTHTGYFARKPGTAAKAKERLAA